MRAGLRPVCQQAGNGGEFINHQLARHLQQRPQPVAFTRSRPYRKNDHAHLEQKNDTQVRQWFGYERYDNPAVWPLVNALCKGALNQLLNYFLPTLKLERKEPVGSQVVRQYGPALTPLSRVLTCAEVKAETKQRWETAKKNLNPFALRRAVDRQLKVIEAHRRAGEA